MPLILAIEPDRRQANQLTALVRGRLKADLVIGESADRALAALGERVPDLVLTAALLSPKDEAALGQRLRELNGVAAHVQTLTIPVLASSRGRGDRAAGGLLSALRRDKPKTATIEGCDPAIFAEQCKEYLERAASERELNAGHAQDVYGDAPIDAVDVAEPIEQDAAAADLASFDEPMLETPAAPIVDHAFLGDPGSFTTTAPSTFEPAHVESTGVQATYLQATSAQATSAEPSFVDRVFAESAFVEPTFVEPASARSVIVETPHVETRHVDTPDVAAHASSHAVLAEPVTKPAKRARKAQPLADLEGTDGPASLVAALAMFEEEEATREEPAHVAAMASEAAHEAADESASDETPDSGVADMDLSSLLDESTGGSRRDDRRQDEASDVEVYDIDDSYLQSSAVTLDAAADKGAPNMVEETEQPQEWVDIIEALRRDAEQMPIRKARGDAGKAAAPAPVKASDPTADAAAKPKRRPGAPPAQDEWGFFDPDQCGFAALLEKLHEITE
jgi:hypothetical protein